MKIAMFTNGSAAGYWRLADPAKYLRRRGIEARVIETGVTKEVCEWADIIVTQMCVDKEMIALIREYQVMHGLKYIVEQDDDIEVDESNPHKIEHEMTQAQEVIKISMGIADMVTTTTNYLANKLRKYNKNVVVLPNYMDLDRWEVPHLPNTSEKVRIGWVGSITHMKDLELVANPLRRICADFPQVQIVTMGDLRIKELFPDLPIECMLGVPFEVYPTRLAGLRLDIGIAPLVDNEFNRCKSNIKWQEYAINHIAGVYSPTVYQGHGHGNFEPRFGHIAYNEEQWYLNLRNLIVNKNLRQDTADNAFALVRDQYDLKKNINKWIKAYKSLV